MYTVGDDFLKGNAYRGNDIDQSWSESYGCSITLRQKDYKVFLLEIILLLPKELLFLFTKKKKKFQNNIIII